MSLICVFSKCNFLTFLKKQNFNNIYLVWALDLNNQQEQQSLRIPTPAAAHVWKTTRPSVETENFTDDCKSINHELRIL